MFFSYVQRLSSHRLVTTLVFGWGVLVVVGVCRLSWWIDLLEVQQLSVTVSSAATTEIFEETSVSFKKNEVPSSNLGPFPQFRDVLVTVQVLYIYSSVTSIWKSWKVRNNHTINDHRVYLSINAVTTKYYTILLIEHHKDTICTYILYSIEKQPTRNK